MKKSEPLGNFFPTRSLLKTLLIMKLAIFITLLTAFQVQAKDVTGQNISLDLKNTEIRKVLNTIERSGNYRFLYNYDLKGLKDKVDLKVENASVSNVLDKMLAGSNLTYKLASKNLYVILSANIANQDVPITGKISNDAGVPLSGVSVLVKGTTIGTTTDANGIFKLSVPDNNVILIISYIGYAELSVPLNGRSEIDITLTASQQVMDQVVVVGYGTQRKSNITGAITSVKSTDLQDMPVPRLEDALKGRTSGVTVASSSGQPGTQSIVMIRGVTSINNFDPLYVVDGVPVAGGIDYLNSGDIESVEVLKDAASAAIYGTKAASGVILITTQKGKSGRLKVNGSAYYGIQAPERKLDLLNATEYATLRNEASLAAGKGIVYPDPTALGEGTDWQKAIFDEQAKIQNYELSFSGGNEKSTFFSSFGIFDQDGIVMSSISNYKRFSVRLNSDHKITNWLRFGQSVSYAHTKSQSGFDANGYFGGPLSSAVNLPPTMPLIVTDATTLATYPYNDPIAGAVLAKDADGNYYSVPPLGLQEMTNPLAFAKRVEGNYGWGDKFVGNAYLEIEPIKGLKIRSNFGVDLAFWGTQSFTPLYYLSTTQSNLTNANFYREMDRAFNWIWTNTASYTRNFGLHNASLLIGSEARDNSGFGVNATFQGIPANSFGQASMNFSVPADRRIGGGFEYQPYNISSLFTRLNYDYNGKYLFTGIIRRDGSSHFGSNKLYGVFPSVSLGWIPSKESFWSSGSAVSYLKLRIGYGVNGNDNLDAYRYVSVVGGVGNYPIGGQITAGNAPLAPSNPDLHWEQTSQLDIGADLVFFKDFNLTVDLFNKKTTDMLMQIKLPGYVGATNQPWGNIASMENKGIEGEIGYRKNINDFTIDIKANATYIRNKVTDIGASDFITYGNFQASSAEISRKVVGQPINVFYGYKYLGIFQTQQDVTNYVNTEGQMLQPNAKPGDFIWADLDGNGRISLDDRTYLGDPTPHFMYGFTIGLDYKNFDFKLFSQGVAGNKIFQQLRRLDISTANYQTTALNRWTGPGTSNSYPRLVDGDPNGNFTNPSSFYLEDGAYFRIKTMQLGYNLPKSLLNKIHFENARIYISGNNLVTFTKYTGYDPEIGGTGSGWLYSIDRGIYPQARSFMAGINFTF